MEKHYIKVKNEQHMREMVKVLLSYGYRVGDLDRDDFSDSNYSGSEAVTLYPESRKLYRTSNSSHLTNNDEFTEVNIDFILPRKREIVINGKTIEISEESYQAFKAQLCC